MGLSAFNAMRARIAEEQRLLEEQKQASTSPVNDGVEVEEVKEEVIKEETQPLVEEIAKPKKKKTAK